MLPSLRCPNAPFGKRWRTPFRSPLGVFPDLKGNLLSELSSIGLSGFHYPWSNVRRTGDIILGPFHDSFQIGFTGETYDFVELIRGFL